MAIMGGRFWSDAYFRRPSCFIGQPDSNRSRDRVSLIFTAWHTTEIRCVSRSKNATAPTNVSEVFPLFVQTMPQLRIKHTDMWRYIPRHMTGDLTVPLGGDVMVECSSYETNLELEFFWKKEGGDWILPSSVLSLKKVTESDGGKYTCTARPHPRPMLKRESSISITVQPESAPWYKSTTIPMTSAAAAVVILVLLVSMSVFLCRRAKQANTRKGPIDDHSQKKPVYSTSVESLPYTCTDKQPLV
ncbi:uncharacterized protein LOC143002592 isoform X2 [Genypterus blacodes]|uniref:uncharacterized protein LOC143002592 isoform X2 n=1 Tax=Genypterus blacodes TaxID=154954 RepID=UPI003F7576AA